jgi:hypothetical protein
MSDLYPDRIWFNPPKFWAATQGMSKEQIDQWMDQIWQLAERFDADALRKYDFITIGNPYRKNAA